MDPGDPQHPVHQRITPAAPPTMPGALEPEAPAWPAKIGVFAIVLGSLGVLYVVKSIIGGLWIPALRPASYRTETVMGWVLNGVLVALALWHLSAGVLVKCRSRFGPPLLLAWACVATLRGVLVSLVFFVGSWYEPGYTGFLFGAFFGVFLLAWPVYLLIFLNHPSRKAYWKTWR
jgi:hypothetical protein